MVLSFASSSATLHLEKAARLEQVVMSEHDALQQLSLESVQLFNNITVLTLARLEFCTVAAALK